MDSRRTLGGFSLIAAPVLLAAGEVLRLSTGSNGADLEVAGLTKDGPNVWTAVGVLEVAGVIAAFPALAALLHIFTRQAPSLANLAVGLLATGFVCQAGYASLLSSANWAAARLTQDGEVKVGESLAPLLYANTLERPLVILEGVAGVTLFVGLLAVATAVWRSNLFPRWTAVLIAVAPLLAIVVDYGFPYLLLVVAWGWIGWKVLRMPTAEWTRLGDPMDIEIRL